MNATTTFSWKQAPELMARLNDAQNHPANEHQDITTFAGFFTEREQLERHVEYYENKAANWVPKRKGRAA